MSVLRQRLDQLQALPEEERGQATVQAQFEQVRQSPAAFATVLSNGQWVPYRHALYMDEAVRKGLNARGKGAWDILIVELPVRHGKALGLDTPIPTPSGWTTMGSLRPGDEVFGGDGKPCRVVAVSEDFLGPTWAVSTDDGDEIVAHENHEWLVTLDDRVAPKAKETRWLAARAGQKPRVHTVGLDLPGADLPIPPYTLGLWLGDGTSRQGIITAHDDDAPHVRGRVEAEGFTTTDQRTHFTFGVLGLKVKLRELGVLGKKHVPEVYLRSSAAQRLALLQGLIDSDGHVAPDGQVEFCSTSLDLALAVQELVRSLGRKASLHTSDATLNGRVVGERHRVTFYMAEAASLPRKAERCRDASEARRRRYLGFSPMEAVPTRCIEVDSPDHLFLAGRSMTPTHNSEFISKWLPAWYLCMNPGKRVGLASYEADFAASWGRKARNLMEEHAHLFGVALDPKVKASNRWETTEGGGMWTAGAGGAITGKGGHLLIVDDPHKNAEEAQSKVMRDHVWDWWQSTFLTRREPGGKVIVVMSRWHEDDLIGRIKKHHGDLRLKVLRLPALAEEDDPLGREVGEALCPERYDEKDLAGTKSSVGPWAWAALYQQRPMPQGGGLFQKHKFRYWHWVDIAEPERGMIVGSHGEDVHIVDPKDCFFFATVDPAFTKGRRADFTAAALWAVPTLETPSLILVDRWRVRVEHAEHAALIQRIWQHRWKPSWIGIERTMASMSVIAEAQRTGLVIRDLRPDMNKVARAETAAALVDSGRIYFPELAEWREEWESELLSFPNGAHDDQVDTLAYAGVELARGTVRARRRRWETRPSIQERCAKQVERRHRDQRSGAYGRLI
jgi:predicted phage terminase large subunit-like protein